LIKLKQTSPSKSELSSTTSIFLRIKTQLTCASPLNAANITGWHEQTSSTILRQSRNYTVDGPSADPDTFPVSGNPVTRKITAVSALQMKIKQEPVTVGKQAPIKRDPLERPAPTWPNITTNYFRAPV
jgi:hypothetical protein